MRVPELAAHLRDLLLAQAWEPARLHLLAGARAARSRSDGTLLGAVAREVPPALWNGLEWARALAWAAYRAADVSLMRDLLAGHPQGLEAFEAYLACAEGDWPAALSRAEAGLDGPDRAVAARYRAQALVRSGAPGWREGYALALHSAQGRDRGLVRLDYAVALTWAGDDVAARPEFAGAASELAGDVWGAAFAWSTLGITCLRLGDLPGAERALGQALAAARREETGQHLVAVELGLGGVYRAHGEYPRARWAFREAGRLATRVDDRVVALLGEARTLALWGRLDEGLAVLWDALGQAGMLDLGAGDHRVFAEVAALRLLLGDERGAREALARAGQVRGDDLNLSAALRAELLRREGQVGEARALLEARPLRPAWVAEVALLFPDLFALTGVEARPPSPWVAVVDTDGPVTVTMHGEKLPLSPASPEAALLALLVLHGGRLGRERIQEAMTLPGRDEDARRKGLSRVVGNLRQVLGWPESVTAAGRTVALSDELEWRPRTPSPGRADLFCEGRLDPWVQEWRLDNLPLMESK